MIFLNNVFSISAIFLFKYVFYKLKWIILNIFLQLSNLSYIYNKEEKKKKQVSRKTNNQGKKTP